MVWFPISWRTDSHAGRSIHRLRRRTGDLPAGCGQNRATVDTVPAARATGETRARTLPSGGDRSSGSFTGAAAHPSFLAGLRRVRRRRRSSQVNRAVRVSATRSSGRPRIAAHRLSNRIRLSAGKSGSAKPRSRLSTERYRSSAGTRREKNRRIGRPEGEDEPPRSGNQRSRRRHLLSGSWPWVVEQVDQRVRARRAGRQRLPGGGGRGRGDRRAPDSRDPRRNRAGRLGRRLVHWPRRMTTPASAPVARPSSIAATPFTKTQGIPVGGAPGSRIVATSSTRS